MESQSIIQKKCTQPIAFSANWWISVAGHCFPWSLLLLSSE